MKPGLKIGVAAALVVLLVLITPFAMAVLGRRAAQDGVEINGIRIVKDGMVTVAVIPLSDNRVALIDAGNDSTGAAILAELSRKNLDARAVSAIFITHGHPDHIAGVGLFPQAEVMSLDREVAIVEGREGGRGPVTSLFPVNPTNIKVTRALKDGETVKLNGAEVRVYAIPGHSAGSAAYLVNGVLFLGDSADVGRGGELQGAPWVFSDSRDLNRQSLVHLYRRLAGEGILVRAMAFAHSGVLTTGLAPLSAFAQKYR